MPTRLHLTARRFVPGVDYEDEAACQRPWLADAPFSPVDRTQLLRAIFMIDDREGMTPDDVWNGDFEFFQRHFDGMAEVPIEGWDLVDDDGVARYQLWLAFVDHGKLLHAGTTDLVDQEGIIQGYWHGDESLGGALQAAVDRLREQRPLPPDCLVTRIRFGKPSA